MLGFTWCYSRALINTASFKVAGMLVEVHRLGKYCNVCYQHVTAHCRSSSSVEKLPCMRIILLHLLLIDEENLDILKPILGTTRAIIPKLTTLSAVSMLRRLDFWS